MIKAIIVVAMNVPKSKAGLLLETDELMIVADEVVTLDIIVYFLINIDFEYLYAYSLQIQPLLLLLIKPAWYYNLIYFPFMTMAIIN